LEIDYQEFLAHELGQAADSPDYQGELQLFIIHYQQAMFEAIQSLQLCSACAQLDLSRLKMNARDLQNSEFGSIPEMMQVTKKRLRDLALLCPTCRATFQQNMLVQFFTIRTQRRDGKSKREKEE
jgi:protein-arginine kinase activator protein McsA